MKIGWVDNHLATHRAVFSGNAMYLGLGSVVQTPD